MTRQRPSLYEGAGQAMLRAAVHVTEPAMPPWPAAMAPVEEWRAWLSTVWSDSDYRRTVSQASPHLADQVQAIIDGRTPKVRRMRRAALATARYAIRYARRSTPYGLFAGVAPLGFAQAASVRFGEEHQAVTRPDPVRLDEMLSAWESDAARMAGAEVCVNTLIRQRDQHIHVPSEGDAEFRLALSPALRLVLDLARSPIGYRQLSDKLAAEFPAVSDTARHRLLGELLRVRLLRSSLRAPATIANPTDVLPPAGRTQAASLRAAYDLRLDADVRLPEQVLTEAETAATILARLVTHPNGTPTWRRWIEQFAERYGENTTVPVEAATDPDRGVGFPAGFVTASEPPRPMSRRDRLLLELAGTAAAEGSCTVALTGALIEELEAVAGDKPHDLAPHLELAAQVHASSVPALDRGDFRLRVLTVSRSAGSMTGRFWHLLPDTEATYAHLPTVDPEAELAQLSFHAGRVPADLLTRAPQALPRVVSIGEFRRPDPNVLFPRDLAVTVADGRPQLVESATGKRLELLAPTAINFLWNNYTPPMARFLGEISRAASPQVTWFDWGAAWTLPFTPALTYRRTILTAARWKIRSRTLPARTAPLQQWADQLHAWRARFRVPERILLAEDDQQLPLDLTRDVDLDVLRAHLDASPFGIATLHDAPPPDADGWIGGRAHSIVVPLARRS
ncbi:lantibiotic biosynthesis dehydratase-like protein [Streptomyces puniciscabiei]|uniref:Lantibiotic biosynthesis dehydratase-like protein n=1 Tax=Streptomyces puniciscabiei TaxID=164348 RepID=A0A542UJ35_9ACTN|nr:lantibiotic dehydratase family protein [Streptomyces puniciscabiei]TQK99085.1 lantibiotic biosynthesis dehydratase-like protein [Streptomyces puniciscabiei]